MPSGDEIRDVQRAAWAGLSAGWEKWDSVIMNQLGPVGAAMIERLDIADDQRHLDIASGTCNADDLPFGGATFDSISVRFGYMFFSRRRQSERRVRARAQARRTSLLVGTK
jgi:hypothetical protein